MYPSRLTALALEDHQLRNLVPDPVVEAALAVPGLTFAEAVTAVLDGYESRPALGEREYDVVRDHESGRAVREFRTTFRTVTYAEMRRRIEAVVGGWRHHPDWRVDPGDPICLLGFNGIDYITLDLACLYVQGISVPLQRRTGRSALDGIFANTTPTVVAATASDVAFAADLVAAHKSVRALVVFDYDERVDDDRDEYAAALAALARGGSTACLVTIDELIATGDTVAWDPPPASEQGAERVAMIMHSSGTTGAPKGAVLFERHAQSSFKPVKNLHPRVRLCFAPMSHTMGRGTVYGTIAHGGTAYFVAKPDMSTLFEDIRLVRPTDGFFFPRALEMVYRHYQSEVARRIGAGDVDKDAVRAEVLAEMRGTFLGDRLYMIKGGSAPTLPEVRQFVTEGLGIEFVERYGTTEAGSITVNDRVRRPHVIDYHLRDVPELGYLTTDKPFPRGELCVKTASLVSGYYGAAAASADLFDQDGFLLTGDIMEERGPDHIVHIDRRNDVLKLTQGEFVAAGALGTIFENGSESIRQMYVYGSSARSYLLAVVVPDIDLIRAALGHEPDEAELRSVIGSELRQVGRAAGLRAFEIPRDFIVETEPFSQENGLLTALGKSGRPAMQRIYGDRLEKLYIDLEYRRSADLIALGGDAAGLSVIDRIGRALGAVLDLDEVDVDQPYSFSDLGGDSLGAAEFAGLLQDMFAVEMPVNAILSATGNPAQWARRIEAELADGPSGLPTFAAVHGRDSRHLDVADLRLSAFLDVAVLDGKPAEVASATARTVLLTGATGFLGRFLCLEWLEILAAEGGMLICLIRAPDHASAVRRLDAVFTGGDPRLEERYRLLSENHLEVVVGDVAEVGLGLGEIDYRRLARDVDRIVHTAALVNHVLSYEHLFASNVAGTASLIGLALTDRKKTIDFVSSTAVFGLLDRGEHSDEQAPLMERIVLGEGYANGYRASKWAAEHLLHAAGRRFGLPVNVFRGNMMLPHRRFHEQMNVDDIFTRLLYSVIVTGLAPASFYVSGPDGSRAKAHYDGLPVDFIAAAIARISAWPAQGVHTFNILNHHVGDGLSLDVFVDWIEAAGYPVIRVADFDDWLDRFEARLRALPEDKRQRSSLAVLGPLRQPATAHEPKTVGRRFDEALRTLDIGPKTPHLDREYIGKCLDDMCRLGLVPSPHALQRNG